MLKRLGALLRGSATDVKLAAVVRLPDRLIVSSSDLPVDGPWREARAWRVEQPDDPAAIGALVRQALAESRSGVPVQPYGSMTDFPSRKCSGRRSFKAFMADAQHVLVEIERGAITLTPSENQGTRGGFSALPDRARALRDASDAELGAAVLAALDDCA